MRPLIAVIAAMGSGVGAHAAPQLRLDVALSSVSVGQTFDIVLKGSAFDLTVGGEVINNVTGGQNLNFTFSNATLQVLSVAIDPRWTFTAANKPGAIDQSGGTVTGTAFGAFPATPDDDFNVATFSVKALAPGSGLLTLLSGQMVGQVAGRAGQLISTGFGTATISVGAGSTVPEPQSWALLLGGLCAVAWTAARPQR